MVRSRDLVLNLDMVGSGNEICLVERDGALFPLKTDPMLNSMLQELDPGIRPIANTRRSGDYRPFLERGIPACSLEMTGSLKASQAYHTAEDRLELIEVDSLGKTANLILGLIEALDKSRKEQQSG